MTDVKIEQITKPEAKLLLKAIDRYNTECDNCDELLTENNFGLIHSDATVCNSLLCITWALETIEEKGK